MKEAAIQGDVESQVKLEESYANGDGVPKSGSDAINP
jgi:TPR repeat protein